MQYLYQTKAWYLTLGTDDLSMIGCWIDAAFAPHPDMKSHTGGFLSPGNGGVMATSSKQKLNTLSTTESELVACSDYTKKGALFSKLFLQAQGYDLKTIVYQDNESAIRLEKNGRRSCSQRTRHIDIRFFYVQDLIEKGIIKLEYCPTELMIADFFTKPLQGALFHRLRDVVMGKVSIKQLLDAYDKQERVGKETKSDVTNEK